MKLQSANTRKIVTRFKIRKNHDLRLIESLHNCCTCICTDKRACIIKMTEGEYCFVSTNQTTARKEEDNGVVIHFKDGKEAVLMFPVFGKLIINGILEQQSESMNQTFDMNIFSPFQTDSEKLFFIAKVEMIIPVYEYSGGGWSLRVLHMGDYVAKAGQPVCISWKADKRDDRYGSNLHFIDQNNAPFTYTCGNENMGKLVASNTLECVYGV